MLSGVADVDANAQHRFIDTRFNVVSIIDSRYCRRAMIVPGWALGRCWWKKNKEKRKFGRVAAPHPPKQLKRKREERKRGERSPARHSPARASSRLTPQPVRQTTLRSHEIIRTPSSSSNVITSRAAYYDDQSQHCTSCWSGTRFFLNCISGGVLVGATVGGRATTDDDDDDDDDEDEDALTRKNNKIFRKEANADKTLEMIIRQLMVERDKSESV